MINPLFTLVPLARGPASHFRCSSCGYDLQLPAPYCCKRWADHETEIGFADDGRVVAKYVEHNDRKHKDEDHKSRVQQEMKRDP